MLVEPLLRGLVVVRGDQQNPVGPGLFGMPGQVDGLGGVVGPGPGNHRHPAGHRVDDDINHLVVLVVGEGRRLSGGPAGDDRIGSPGDLKFNQLPQGRLVDPALLERGHYRYHCSLKHRQLS